MTENQGQSPRWWSGAQGQSPLVEAVFYDQTKLQSCLLEQHKCVYNCHFCAEPVFESREYVLARFIHLALMLRCQCPSVHLSVTFVHCTHRVQWIPDNFACLDRWMSLLLTDNALPGSSDGIYMMPGLLVEEGRGHLTLSWPLLGPLVINAENNKKTKKEKKSRVQDSAVSLSEIRHLIPNRFSYTVSGKKLCHFIFGSNFAKYWSILKIFSLLCSARNFW